MKGSGIADSSLGPGWRVEEGRRAEVGCIIVRGSAFVYGAFGRQGQIQRGVEVPDDANVHACRRQVPTAEAAANLYVSLFRDSTIQMIERYGPGENGREGSVKQCHLIVAGLRLRCFDSPIKHAFTFTPSLSLFVDCQSESELDDAFAKLSSDGSVLMPPDNYGFSSIFAWVSDRFGVSWQLNLP